ncbi:MAG: tetratricopeptide repeat protein [Betaproteobacteria bacterium]|nr:tetratricopeptide repeat protein [Betaproteobacteria bacterium]
MQEAAESEATKALVERATSLHRNGDLAGAERLYRQVLQTFPTHAAALGLLGLIEHDNGRTDDGIGLLRRSIEVDPENASMRLNLGTVYAESGRMEDAIDQFRNAVRITPTNTSAIENLIMALRDLGRVEESLPLLEQQVALDPSNAMTRYRLAASLVEAGHFERALNEFDHAALKSARLPGVNYQRGIAHLRLLQYEQAQLHLEAAVKENARHFEAYFLLGTVLLERNKSKEALAALELAQSLNPNSVETLCLKASAQIQLKSYSIAEETLKQAILLSPANSSALDMFVSLALATWDLGDEPQARKYLSIHLRNKPDPSLQAAHDLMLPQIMGTREEMLNSRARFERNLDALLESTPRLTLPHMLIGTSNFYLAYHGLSDKTVLQKYAQFCLAACPPLRFTAPHCESGKSRSGRKRIGFLSKFIMNHSVSMCFSRVIEAMSATGEFEVHLISQHPFDDESVNQNYPNFQGRKIQLPSEGFIAARDMIAALELDILVYLDIGMDLDSYCLALARLASVQCVLGGHPDTTGIPNMDYFISSALTEVDEADAHYSETLLRLPISTFYFHRPQLPYTAYGHRKGRSEFGLPTQGRIYLCPSVLQKLHPDFDLALARILELDPNGHVILFRDPRFSAWNEATMSRLDKTVHRELRNRILMAPWVHAPLDFANVNALADVILDPFHFGLGSTAITTFTVGVPTVTKPSDFLRGRVGLFFSRLMDLPECVATDTEDFAQRAVAIATNRDLREDLGRRILRNNSVLYNNSKPIQDLADALRKL